MIVASVMCVTAHMIRTYCVMTHILGSWSNVGLTKEEAVLLLQVGTKSYHFIKCTVLCIMKSYFLATYGDSTVFERGCSEVSDPALFVCKDINRNGEARMKRNI